jgi:hypothetical protein
MPKLSRVGANAALWGHSRFELDGVPNLEAVEFAAKGIDLYMENGLNGNRNPDVRISRTALRKIDFLNLFYRPPDSREIYESPDDSSAFTIRDNPHLTDISLPRWNGTMRYLDIGDNGPNISVSLDGLREVQSLTFNNVAHLSLANVVNVTGTLNVTNNTLEVLHFPKLKLAAGNTTIANNSRLNSIRMNALNKIGWVSYRDIGYRRGDLRIENNRALINIDELTNITFVGGGLWISGNFTK